MIYLYLRALHFFSIICWYSGLFYLPRLFVYQVESTDPTTVANFMYWQRRLFYIIMLPSVIATVGSGLSIIYLNPPAYLYGGWFHVKMFTVGILLLFHARCGWHMRQLRLGKNIYSSFYFRVFNEVPSFALIIILIMAVIKPF